MRERKTIFMLHPSTRLTPSAVLALAAIAVLAPPAVAATRNLTEADQGATIQLTQGDKLVVRLKAIPSTGYSWYLMKGFTRLLKLEGQTETSPEQPIPGSPVAQVFTLRAIDAGTGDLVLHYVRAWEKPSDDEQRFTVHLTVR
jgi:predicted secreted protein